MIIDCLEFCLEIPGKIGNSPSGYLFICPVGHLQTGATSFGWPACPAYWSLDPCGAERLSVEEAMHLGFPALELTTKVEGLSWDATVYAGLREIHEAKGFDPDSQDVALDEGYPLYQVSNETEALFAHGNGNCQLISSD